MKNIVTASVEFYFKGEKFSPSMTIALDEHLQANATLNSEVLYSVIAKENNIGMYSYEYEMMQAEEIQYTHVEGFVEDYISEGSLDFNAFEAAWQNNNSLQLLLGIAEKHMKITDFEQHTELKQALLAAYELGKQETKK